MTGRPNDGSRRWTIGALELVLTVGAVLRYGTNVLDEKPVFDRYLLPWSVLLPIARRVALSRKLLVVQALILAAIFARHAWNLLL